MKFGMQAKALVAIAAGVALLGATSGCSRKLSAEEQNAVSRVEAAASKAESAASRAEQAARAAADAASRAEAAAAKAEAIFSKHLRK
ncbi:MAG: alanine-zipper protein [Candidatus Binatia bacterium]|nr:alanine-zipper protein [Candidatus Binatia bacterium]